MKKLITLLLVLLLTLSAVSALADVYSDAGFIKKIPMKPKYTEAVENKGNVEKITYTCRSYALEALNPGQEILVEKDLYVYLPYGYSEETSYNVIYLMHGGGEDERYWLSEERMGKGTLALLDNMNAKGDCEPTIIVTPTTNAGKILTEGEFAGLGHDDGVRWYWKELREDVIPLIETKYHTFANGDTSLENLQATRDHRAFAGFSMGSMTTFCVTMNDLDILGYFGNYSGALITAEEYEAALNSETFKDLPVLFWYNGNGSGDMAHDEHQVVFKTVTADMPERFTDGVNCCWVEFKGGTHAYNCWLPHLYNCMRVFFK